MNNPGKGVFRDGHPEVHFTIRSVQIEFILINDNSFTYLHRFLILINKVFLKYILLS